MSELKAYIAPTPDGTGLADYYLKSEADKAIAELKRENERLKKQSSCTFSEDCLRVRHLGAENRRLKRALYKACVNWMRNRQVAMACFHLEARAMKFDKAIDKCQAKMEKYK